MILASLIFVFVVLPYAIGFAMLAFLPHWRWLLPAAAAACIWNGQGMFMPEEAVAPDLNAVLLIFVGIGCTCGLIARASILGAQAYGQSWASPKLVLPTILVAAPLVLAGLISIARSLQTI